MPVSQGLTEVSLVLSHFLGKPSTTLYIVHVSSGPDDVYSAPLLWPIEQSELSPAEHS